MSILCNNRSSGHGFLVVLIVGIMLWYEKNETVQECSFRKLINSRVVRVTLLILGSAYFQ